MFTADAPFALFDYFRVPYTVAPAQGPFARGVHRLAPTGGTNDRSLYWVDAHSLPRRWRTATRFAVGGCRVAGHVATVAPDRLVDGGGWQPLLEVTDASGEVLSTVTTNANGDVLLPFDPGEIMQCLWSEGYRRLGLRSRVTSAGRAVAVRAWYRLRPALPRGVQLAVRRRLAGAPRTDAFPRWPLETGLHDLYDVVLGLCADVAGAPVPHIAPWPDGAHWCLLLTHDVETARGLADIALLREPERARALRSSWNLVPERYDTPTETVADLRRDGCEVGVHGLRHDGHDLESLRTLRGRLPRMRAAAERWDAVGFRSPATQRSWDLMPMLGFDYDSSSTDTDPYEPQPGGCCTYLPFFNRDLVELPITLPQDHTLFAVLGHRDGRTWTEKAGELRRRGGLVLALSHPDYAQGAALRAWVELLDEVHDDPTMWHALPQDAARWWRARAASSIELRDGSWMVTGPAAGRARVTTVGTTTGPPLARSGPA